MDWGWRGPLQPGKWKEGLGVQEQRCIDSSPPWWDWAPSHGWAGPSHKEAPALGAQGEVSERQSTWHVVALLFIFPSYAQFTWKDPWSWLQDPHVVAGQWETGLGASVRPSSPHLSTAHMGWCSWIGGHTFVAGHILRLP